MKKENLSFWIPALAGLIFAIIFLIICILAKGEIYTPLSNPNNFKF
jgi:hypothetical protein